MAGSLPRKAVAEGLGTAFLLAVLAMLIHFLLES